MIPDPEDTIVALSSAPGPGARAIVRFFDRAVVDRCLEFVGRSGRAGGTIRVGIASHDAIRCWINEDSEPAPIA